MRKSTLLQDLSVVLTACAEAIPDVCIFHRWIFFLDDLVRLLGPVFFLLSNLSRVEPPPTPDASACSRMAGLAAWEIAVGSKVSSRSGAKGAAVTWWRPAEGSEAVMDW
jgi:hypothetical protein